MWTRLLCLDRRWVFAAIAATVVVPYLLHWSLPTGAASPQVRKVFDILEQAKPGEVLLIAYDYGPSTMPELHPMAMALTRHALRRGLRVIAMTIDLQGALMADDVLRRIAREMPNKRAGVDFVNLGYKPGDILVVLGMGEDVQRVYTRDAHGNLTSRLPVLRGVRNFDSIRLVVDLASSDTPLAWILYAHERFGATVAAGVTAVMATDFYPYLDTGQLVGMLNGMRGAADYEQLIRRPDQAVLGMTSQSLGHVVVLVLVLLGNLAFFASRRQRRSLRRSPSPAGRGSGHKR